MSSTVVLIDEDSFFQVFINLLDNAVKFSKKGDNQQIAIRIDSVGKEEVLFAVRDYGPGVPRDQLKKI